MKTCGAVKGFDESERTGAGVWAMVRMAIAMNCKVMMRLCEM